VTPPVPRSEPHAGRLRRAGPRDLEGVVALWLAIGEHHAGMHPLFALRADPDAEARELVCGLLRDPDTLVLVAEDPEGRLEGLCVARRLEGSRVARVRERAEITDLGVAPERRRRGIGRALAEGALGWLRERGVPHVAVRVADANPAAQAFWRRLGFADLVDVLVRPL